MLKKEKKINFINVLTPKATLTYEFLLHTSNQYCVKVPSNFWHARSSLQGKKQAENATVFQTQIYKINSIPKLQFCYTLNLM